MVDTLVLGTSAKAWEFESLHAQIKTDGIMPSVFVEICMTRTPQSGALYRSSSGFSDERSLGERVNEAGKSAARQA